ncbi:hypothetical protein B566_EDAN016226 [Ephemera danica]|nr:hypothetical protein B566_EDAN016226 [Ephemera danica]
MEQVTGQCLSAHHDAVSCWLREVESRCSSAASTPTTPTDKPVPVSVSGSQLVQSAVNSASAVGRRSVEDVRQKVTNLLRKK